MYGWIPEKIEQSRKIFRDNGVALEFEFKPPASLDEIRRCEEDLGFTLPHSYKEFLRFSNGANLFCCNYTRFEIAESTQSWFSDSGILIQSTSSLVPFNHYQDRVYVEDTSEKQYIAFSYLGYVATGDFCSFDISTYANSEYKVLDSRNDFSVEEWQSECVIAESFDDWLIKMFDEVVQNQGRPEYWMPSPLRGDFS